MKYSEYKMYEALLKDNEEKNKKIETRPHDGMKDLITVGSVGLLILYFIALFFF